MTIPVLTAWLMAMVFSPNSDITKTVTLNVAVLDRDDDFLSGVIRSLSNQGNPGESLKLHFVETEADGIQLVERREVSAFVVLPENLTTDLLDGHATSLDLYKNPAEAILPKIVEEGLRILCIGISQGLKLLQPEIKSLRDLAERETMPEASEVANVASSTVTRLETVEPYLLPPLIQFQTIEATDYQPRSNRDQNLAEEPIQ